MRSVCECKKTDKAAVIFCFFSKYPKYFALYKPSRPQRMDAMKATAVHCNYHPAGTAFLKIAMFVFCSDIRQRGVDPTLWSFLRLCFVLKVAPDCVILWNVSKKKKKKNAAFPLIQYQQTASQKEVFVAVHVLLCLCPVASSGRPPLIDLGQTKHKQFCLGSLQNTVWLSSEQKHHKSHAWQIVNSRSSVIFSITCLLTTRAAAVYWIFEWNIIL